MWDVICFVLGWLLFLYLQMINSLRSGSNGLTDNWKGMKAWLRIQSDVIAWRAFISAVFYPSIIQKITATIEPILASQHLIMYNWGFSGLAGFGACGGLYQLTGLTKFFRGRELHELIPPPEDKRERSDNSNPPKGSVDSG